MSLTYHTRYFYEPVSAYDGHSNLDSGSGSEEQSGDSAARTDEDGNGDGNGETAGMGNTITNSVRESYAEHTLPDAELWRLHRREPESVFTYDT